MGVATKFYKELNTSSMQMEWVAERGIGGGANERAVPSAMMNAQLNVFENRIIIDIGGTPGKIDLNPLLLFRDGVGMENMGVMNYTTGGTKRNGFHKKGYVVQFDQDDIDKLTWE